MVRVPAYLPQSVADQLVEKHTAGYRFSDLSGKLQKEILLKEIAPAWHADDTSSAVRGNCQKNLILSSSDSISVHEPNIRSERRDLASTYLARSSGQDIGHHVHQSMYDLHKDNRWL